MLRLSKTEKQLVHDCWMDRKRGTHGWRPRANGFLTIEPYQDVTGEFLLILYTDNVDDLGYPMGNHVFSMAVLYENDLKRRKII